MAIVYPTIGDQEVLVGFATRRAGCTSEDVELLSSTCTALIADVQTINNFIVQLTPSSQSNVSRPSFGPDSGGLPISYLHGGGMSVVPGSHSTCTAVGSDPLRDVKAQFRPHEAMMRFVRHRLRRGKASLTSINEKYDYVFTVVTLGKGGRMGSVKGEAVTPGRSTNIDGQDANSSTRLLTTGEQHHEEGASVKNGGEESAADTRRVRMAYTKFLQAFDVLLVWVSDIVGILDGEGAVPSAGQYVLQEIPEEGGEGAISRRIGPLNEGTGALVPHVSDAVPILQSPPQESSNSSEPLSSVQRDSGTPMRRSTRTIRVTRYELHDVTSVFRALQDQANLFYLQEYTFFDPRVQRRLLIPAYYRALRETVRDINAEVERLQQLEVSLTRRSSDGMSAVFRPTIREFCYLRDSLRLYWSSCVTEDDTTSLQYHRMHYNKYVLEAGEVVEMLKNMRRPPSREVASDVLWVLSPEERAALEAGFESFWRLRERVLELRDSLTNDIAEKNRTHRYRMPAPPSPTTTSRNGDKGSGVGGVAQWALSVMRSWAQSVTCNAEVADDLLSMKREDEGFFLSTTSPLYESKKELLCLVQRLVAAVEAQATLLEKEYPDTFFRDSKAMWARRAKGAMRYMESISVVFSPPV
ncbi:variant surface glycoprotein 3275 [Trypanosoma grayi]|uniref:variant surface glycoprotein 3275 n=1 Tax=Trypanosoma grayi TaxID=71804 RepID=UPI0004F41243|nr:variant surface glycoprotein 3275 [Trypanosoma grayi]KEG10810.1 variant surface glycoprotein 3275 [Trypanosoma grayi]